MPLARVICRSAEKAAALITHLHTLGYKVETVAPEAGAITGMEGAEYASTRAQTEPADLEIQLDECTVEEALARAEAFARANPHAQIFVAPEVVTDSDSGAVAEADRRGGVRAWLWEKFSRRGARQDWVYTAEQQAPALTESLAVAETNTSEPAEAGTLTEAVSMAVPTEITPGPAVTFTPFPEQAAADMQARQEQMEAALAHRQAEELARIAEIERRVKEEQERERQRLAQEAEIARRNQEAETAVLRMALEAERIRLETERLRLEAEQRRYAELISSQRAQSQPAVESLASQPAVSNAEGEPELPSPVEVQPIVAGQLEPVVLAHMPVGDQFTSRAASTARATDIRGTGKKRTRKRRSRQWQIAALTGAAFAVLLAGAWSLATSPTPPSPLPQNGVVPGTMRQEVPFGPVSITNQAGPVAAPVRATPVITKPVAPVRSGKPTAVVRAPAVRNKTRSPRRRSAAGNHVADSEVVVHHNYDQDEVVVRHYVHPPSDTGQARAHAKRISDTDANLATP